MKRNHAGWIGLTCGHGILIVHCIICMPHSTDYALVSPLILAAAAGRLDACAVLLDSGVSANVKGEYGETALHWAALLDNSSLAQLLISRGAHTGARDCKNHTPIDVARAYNHHAMTTCLERSSMTAPVEGPVNRSR